MCILHRNINNEVARIEIIIYIRTKM